MLSLGQLQELPVDRMFPKSSPSSLPCCMWWCQLPASLILTHQALGWGKPNSLCRLWPVGFRDGVMLLVRAVCPMDVWSPSMCWGSCWDWQVLGAHGRVILQLNIIVEYHWGPQKCCVWQQDHAGAVLLECGCWSQHALDDPKQAGFEIMPVTSSGAQHSFQTEFVSSCRWKAHHQVKHWRGNWDLMVVSAFVVKSNAAV